MNWGECKLITLQTMFANEGTALNADDSNQDYLDAMPGKANEAMLQLATVGRPIRKRFRIALEDGAEETATAEQLTLPVTEGAYHIDMAHYCARFRCIEPNMVMLESGGIYGAAEDWDLEGDTILCIPGTAAGVYTVWYCAYPQTITASTPDGEELDLAPEAAALVPLYMAGALYKEDELAMATMFRNEFEDGLQKLRQAYMDSARGGGFGMVRNESGWW